MAECLVLPVAGVVQPLALAEPAEAEGPGTDFTLEEEPVEDGPETAEPEAVSATALTSDPLQMLIEDLSGITGTLREAMPQAADKTANDASVAEATSPAVPPSLPETRLVAGIEGAAADPAEADMAAETSRRSPAGILDMTLPETQADGAALDPDPGDMPLPEAEALLADSTAGPLPALLRNDAAIPAEARPARAALVPVARQIAEAVVTARDDLVEIALAPEELGKIRMVVTGPDHNPHVTVWVERPEVLDQLRRNAAVLQECLGEAGMPEASFDFQGDTPSDSRRGQPAAAPADPSPAFEAAQPLRSIPVAWTPMAIPARLDIRI